MQCITNAISLTLCPAKIWFANNLRNMVCLEKRNAVAKHEILHLLLLLLSSRAAAARWRGGEGCSLPATHQIGRSTILNISGNSWDLFINVLSFFLKICDAKLPVICSSVLGQTRLQALYFFLIAQNVNTFAQRVQIYGGRREQAPNTCVLITIFCFFVFLLNKNILNLQLPRKKLRHFCRILHFKQSKSKCLISNLETSSTECFL